MKLAGVEGAATLGSLSPCANDGEVNCITNSNFPAVVVSNLAAKVVLGQVVAGITGTFNGGAYPSCSTDGEMNCSATNTYAAALTTNLAPKIFSGNTVAGVPGTSTMESHTNCTTSGSSSCIVNGPNFKAVDMAVAIPGNLKSGVTLAGVMGNYGPNCTVDGAANCLVDGINYKAAQLSNFTLSDIRSGVTIAGVAGNAVIEGHSSCSSDGGTGCISNASYTAALTIGLASKVLSGQTVAGITGTGVQETHSNCLADAGTGCVATASFPAVNASVATAGNIKSGVTLAGVLGDYPSSTHPLAGATTTPDLDLATFTAKISNKATFEWFNSAGVRFSTQGDRDINAVNIQSGVDIFGITGTLTAVAVNCIQDGQQNCLATAQYQAVNTSAFSGWDVRIGKTVAGYDGQLAFLKNRANTTLFNRTTGSGASATLDLFDSIDDSNNYGTFPPESISVAEETIETNWLRDPNSDTDLDGTCNGVEDCVYLDRISGIYWLRSTSNGNDGFENAIGYCNNHNLFVDGGYSDWRVPTQKELLQAYVDGIFSQMATTKLRLGNNYYWSSTTTSTATTEARQAILSTGLEGSRNKGNVYDSICVR